jgi:hypothetical protein
MFGLWVGVGLVTAIVAGGCVLLAKKRRQGPRKCRSCGGVAEAGDLCNQCRHAAADALRHATADRAAEQRKLDEQRRRNDAITEQQRQEAARGVEDVRQAEETRLQRLENAQRKRDEEEMRWRQEDSDRQRAQNADASDHEEFDPHAVLEVPRGASPQEIAVAYAKAKAKFDPEQTTHLSEEVQSHFKRKAEAVDRAYQMLTGA